MRLYLLFALVLAVVAASCGASAPGDDSPVGAQASETSTIPSSARESETTVPEPTTTTAAPTTTTTTTIPPLIIATDTSNIPLRPPLPPEEAPGPEYFSFAEVSGVDSYTAHSTIRFDDGRQAEEMTRELRVEGATAHVRSDWHGEVSELVFTDGGAGGAWIRTGSGEWAELARSADPAQVYNDMYFVSPETVHQVLHPVIDGFAFIGWDDTALGTAAHFRGDADAVADLIGAGVGDAAGATGSIDVWLDPDGYFTSYFASFEVDGFTFSLEWELSDLDSTVVEVPGEA